MHKYTTDELVAQKPSAVNFAKLARHPIIFILHNIRSLQNVGLFFRLADAFLVKKIYLTGYTGHPRMDADSRDEKIIRHAENEINKTAIKLVPFVPWEKVESVISVINSLKKEGYQIVAVEQTDASIDYQSAPFKFPVALIFGHERTGVEDELLTSSDFITHIPMLGMGNSHNVAVSGSIITGFLTGRLLDAK